VIPGGESTAITRLMRLYGLEEAVRRFAAPVFGTCAGMILLDRAHLGLVDVDVERNGYGRQLASFEADLDLGDDAEPMRGVFIRAPRVTASGGDVEVLASHDGVPVLLRQGRFLVASFHPELTGDTRVHEKFLELVREARPVPDATLASVPRWDSAQARPAEESAVQRGERGGAGLRPAGSARSGT
jgi:5'-phosphate synthase pdxT subunit